MIASLRCSKHALSATLLSLLCTTGLGAASGDLRLVEAAGDGDRVAVQSLLRDQVDVNAAQPDGTTALAWAAHWDDLEMAELLIAANADVNAVNEYGVTPLSLACTNGSAPMVEKLLRAGANPNLALWTGEAPLMTCTGSGAVAAVELLLGAGANPNARESTRGQTALMWAVAKNHEEIVRLLIEKGAAVSARSDFHELPEPFKLPCSVEEPCRNGKMDGVSYGPNYHFRRTEGGFTPLLFAAQQGNIESARLLLEAGADVDESTPDDGTALVIATASGHEQMARFLLERGANPNAKDGYGITPLHYTLHEGLLALHAVRPRPTDSLGWDRPNMPELMKTLLDYGADVNAPIEKDIPPYEYAPIARSIGNNMPQLSLVGATPLMLATATGELDVMRYLVERRARALVKTESNATPLLIAAGLGRERSNRTPNEEQQTFLEALKMMVELGGDVNAPDAAGRTPLHMATLLGSDDAIRYLVEKGADLEAKDKYGQTALTIALGDPEGVIFRPLAGGGHDFTFRRRSHDKQEKIAQLLLDLGAAPFTGEYKEYGD
jgi:ankyrin repeat protein